VLPLNLCASRAAHRAEILQVEIRPIIVLQGGEGLQSGLLRIPPRPSYFTSNTRHPEIPGLASGCSESHNRPDLNHRNWKFSLKENRRICWYGAKVLLLDEPFEGLFALHRGQAGHTIQALQEDGLSVLMA
jgi:hypothetical protein